MERFFAELEARFRTSSSENLVAKQNFAPLVNETAERMFARFNVIAKPLEDERPRVMTREQLETTYLVHLRSLPSRPNALVVDRDIRESERDRTDRGLEPLSRHEIHELVLRQEREVAIEETKLRAVGLSPSQGSERTENRKVKKSAVEDNFGEKDVKKEERICKSRDAKGHIVLGPLPIGTSASLVSAPIPH